jgi:hypothetical protein
MFWLYFIAGCFSALILVFAALFIMAIIRRSSTKSHFDIGY